MSNGSLLMVQHENLFAAISVLHYETYKDKRALLENLASNDDLQCITTKQDGTVKHSGKALQNFGDNQQPALSDYADGVDTMQFLSGL